jgi:thiamine phosphate synthase YjbQ (UPF0047 family)
MDQPEHGSAPALLLLRPFESIVVVDGALDLGEFGYVYFIDWDQVRARPRTVQVQIIGE